MQEQLNLEIAKLLDKKGFNEPCRYLRIGVSYSIRNQKKGQLFEKRVVSMLKPANMFLAPTLTEVVMWLYKKHKIWIRISCFEPNVFYPDIFNFNKKGNTAFSKDVHITFASNEMRCKTPTKAYLLAIKHTLKNLI